MSQGRDESDVRRTINVSSDEHRHFCRFPCIALLSRQRVRFFIFFLRFSIPDTLISIKCGAGVRT